LSLVEKWKSRHHPAQFKPTDAPAWRRVPEDDAMAKDTKNEQRAEAETTAVRGGLEMAIRQRARMFIDAIVEEELEIALGAAPSVRVGEARAGYRHGTRTDVDDEPRADDVRDAAGATRDVGGDDGGMAQPVGAPVSAPERAGG